MFVLNLAVVLGGFCFQGLFLSTYTWSTILSLFQLTQQTAYWFFEAICFSVVLLPTAVLLILLLRRKISLERANKSYLIVLLSIAPFLALLLWFVIGALPLIDIALNPRKL
jgi:hypothetical protein